MAILDTVGTAIRTDAGAGAKDLVGTITVGTLTNGIMIACISCARSVTGVKLDNSSGTAFTRWGDESDPTDTADVFGSIWYLLNPPSGAHGIHVISAYTQGSAVLSTWSGVNQDTPFRTLAIANDAQTVNATSVSGDIVIDCVAAYASTSMTVGANQTELGQATGTPIKVAASYETATSTSTTMSWTGGEGARRSISAVALIDALSNRPRLSNIPTSRMVASTNGSGPRIIITR